MRKNVKALWGVLALLTLAALPRSAAAQFGTDHATKAKMFLEDGARAKRSLGFIQLGCTLKGVRATVQPNADGSFTVDTRYNWSGLDNGNDHTHILYDFNAAGRLTGLRVGDTSAVFFKPYSVADGTIQVLAEAIRRDLQNADPAVRNVGEQLIRQANARGIHLLLLQLEQPR